METQKDLRKGESAVTVRMLIEVYSKQNTKGYNV